MVGGELDDEGIVLGDSSYVLMETNIDRPKIYLNFCGPPPPSLWGVK